MKLAIERWGPAERAQFTAAVETALRAVGKEFGVELETKGYTYDAVRLTVKFDAKITTGEAAEAQVVADTTTAFLLGLPKDIVGRTFLFRRKTYQVTGLNYNRPKYPISAKRLPDGKQFKFPADAVMRGQG